MSLVKPTCVFRRITDINIDNIRDNNIKGLLLDVDNTLSTHHGDILIDGLEDWLEKIKSSDIRLIVVSNSKKNRIAPFAEKIGLPFISLACKPFSFGYKKAVKMMALQKNQCAIIGDQLFTDILGANLYGVKSFLVRPVKLEDGWTFRVRRFFEKKILKDKF